MLTKVQKWGNSLALRIPKSYALEAKLVKDTDVDSYMVEGQLVIRPVNNVHHAHHPRSARGNHKATATP